MSTTRYPSFKAAACHTAPIFLDSARTIDKATSLIEEAAGNGASLIAFPESFVPGFPIWAALRAPILNHDFFFALAREAIRLDGPEIGRIRAAARRHGVHVSLGFTEGTDASVGCLWNSNVLIGPDGAVLNLHRKLVPTFFEKLIWANGDARGLRVEHRAGGRAARHADLRREHQSALPLRADGGRRTGPHVVLSADLADAAAGRGRGAAICDARSGSAPVRMPSRPRSSTSFRRALSIFAMRDAVGQADTRTGSRSSTSRRGSVSLILDPTGELMSDVLSDQGRHRLRRYRRGAVRRAQAVPRRLSAITTASTFSVSRWTARRVTPPALPTATTSPLDPPTPRACTRCPRWSLSARARRRGASAKPEARS